MKLFVAPPFLDYQNLFNTCRELVSHCAGLHFDIMDGVFVPEKRFSVETINQLRREPIFKNSPFWIHLMVADPKTFIDKLVLMPGDILSFHYEAILQQEPKLPHSFDVSKFEQLVEMLEHKNIMPSLAVNPETSVKSMLDALFLFEHVLMMGVNPGKSGQLFIKNVQKKIQLLNAYAISQEINLTIAVDGGVNQRNIIDLQDINVNEVAITSAIFNDENPLQSLIDFKKLLFLNMI